jgi:IS605 OrfB family transposase
MHRTIRPRLDPTPEQAKLLAETARQFTAAFNLVSVHGWEQQEKNGVRLHHATYYASKAMAPGLVSDLHTQARVKASAAITSALDRRKEGRKASCPRARACPPRYNLHTYSLDWIRGVVRLSTVGGKQSLVFHVPDHAPTHGGFPAATADLVHWRGQWYLHVVGCDLGVARAAVTSDNRFHGKCRWKELEARDFRFRRKLQKCGTRSAKRHLRIISGRTARRHRDHDHVVSRRIVDGLQSGSTLAVENLTNIRSRMRAKKANGGRRRLHGWSFAVLKGFLTYKCEERGIRVEGVDPRHTSQTCSRCGFQSRSNRRSQTEFHCGSCGYQTNADRNGAINIRQKLLASRAIRVIGGPPSSGLSCPPVLVTGEAQVVSIS